MDSSVTTVLEATGGNAAVPVIVYTEPGAEGVVDQVAPSGVETTTLAGFDAVAAYLTQEEIDALAACAGVDLIVADNPVFGFDYASSLDVTNLAIGLDKVAAPAAGGPAGAGVGVAVLDSGIATTSDLGSSRIVGWKDFVNGRRTPYDDAGHGTFVAGLIAGDGTASLPLDDGGSATMQFRGVAPQANIVSIKVLDSTGQGRVSSVMAGVLWAIAHRQEYNIRVLNLSIGSNPVAPTDFDPIAQAAELAWKNGITVVCAAGNEGEFGPGGILSPGNSPYVITVGADRHAPDGHDRRRRGRLLQLSRPDALGRVRQAGPRGSRQPAHLAARQGLLHRHHLPAEPDPRGPLRAGGSERRGPELPHALRHQHRGAGGRRRGGAHDRAGPEPQPRRRQGAHGRHRRPAAQAPRASSRAPASSTPPAR